MTDGSQFVDCIYVFAVTQAVGGLILKTDPLFTQVTSRLTQGTRENTPSPATVTDNLPNRRSRGVSRSVDVLRPVKRQVYIRANIRSILTKTYFTCHYLHKHVTLWLTGKRNDSFVILL